jgi:hypothetical protein
MCPPAGKCLQVGIKQSSVRNAFLLSMESNSHRNWRNRLIRHTSYPLIMVGSIREIGLNQTALEPGIPPWS